MSALPSVTPRPYRPTTLNLLSFPGPLVAIALNSVPQLAVNGHIGVRWWRSIPARS